MRNNSATWDLEAEGAFHVAVRRSVVVLDDPDRQGELRRVFSEARDRVVDGCKEIGDGLEVSTRLSRLMDVVLIELFRPVFRHLSDAHIDMPSLALCAVGSYGRGEMSPFSDSEILLLHDGSATDAFLEEAKHLFLTPLWDLGVDVVYRVLSLDECVARMNKHPRFVSPLMNARYLSGSEDIVRILADECVPAYLRENGIKYATSALSWAQERHLRHGNSVTLMEPDIKENPGGLRDLQLILRIERAIRLFGDTDVQIAQEDKRRAHEAYNSLLGLRIIMHKVAGMRADVLDANMQSKLVAHFNVESKTDESAEQELMRKVFRWFRSMSRLVNIEWERVAECSSRTSGRLMAVKPIGTTYMAIGKALSLVKKGYFDTDSIPATKRMMQTFLTSHVEDVPLSVELEKEIKAHSKSINDEARKAPEVVSLFFKLLESKKPITATLRVMNATGFLGELIPEFGELKDLISIDGYHEYTVDEHSFRALSSVDDLILGKAKTQCSFDRIRTVRGLALLRLSLLIQNVGKSRACFYEERSAAMSPRICERLGIEEGESRLVYFLVLRHSILLNGMHSMQRDDISFVNELAEEVSSGGLLSLLHIMTFCNGEAQSVSSWPKWKDEMLSKMVGLVCKAVENECCKSVATHPLKEVILEKLPEGITARDAEKLIDLMPNRYAITTQINMFYNHLCLVRDMKDKFASMVIKRDEQSEILLCSTDRFNMFATICGVLAKHKISVLFGDAIAGTDGTAFVRLRVNISEVDQAVIDDIKNALSKRLVLDTVEYSTEVLAGVEVRLDNLLAEDYTVIDVLAPDSLGLLYRIASAISLCGLDIYFARVATYRSIAGNVYYVKERTGEKIVDIDALERLKQKLLLACTLQEK